MTLKITLAAFTLLFITNSHAGWFDELLSKDDEIKQKIESAKDAVVNSDTATSVKSKLNNEDIVAGLKQALNKGATFATDKLGKTDGFLKNADVKIPMPSKLAKVESLLRKAGQDKYADEFVTTMNRAAESAVPLTLDIIKQGVTDMSIEDAKNILQGPDDAATQYLKQSGSEQLKTQITPIIKDATAKAGVTGLYKKMYGKLGFAGKYLNLEDYNVDNYVTDKTMVGLFAMIAQQEKKIRDNPAERTTDILKSVFATD